MRPLIYLFQNQGKYFVYDANKNVILHVPPQIYIEATRLMDDLTYEKCNMSRDMKKLYERGYFRESPVNEIKFSDLNTIKAICDNNMERLILQVTQNCNFACRYCNYADDGFYERKHCNNNMSFYVAQKAIAFFRDHSPCSSNIEISFYGGEPLLNFDLIKNSILLSERLFIVKNIKFEVITNASLLSDEIISFLADHNVTITISLDGPKNIQDACRRMKRNGRGTFDIVYKNIKGLMDKFPNYYEKYVHFQPVITTTDNYLSSLDFFKSTLQADSDRVHPIVLNMDGLDWVTAESSNKTHENEYDKRVQEMQKNMYLEKYRNKIALTSTYHHNGPCIPGAKKLFVTYDGRFLPCEKMNEANECNYIGDIIKGLDYQHIYQNICNIGKITEKECKNCWAMRFCSICIADIEDKNLNNIKRIKLRVCQDRKVYIKDFMNQITSEYLKNKC